MSEHNEKRIFSENLNHYLELHHKTQKEAADAIGVSPQTFNTWCKGIALPRMSKLQRLADFFGISKAGLIEERPDSVSGFESRADSSGSSGSAGSSDFSGSSASASSAPSLHFDNIFPAEKHVLPLLGSVACGKPIFMDTAEEGFQINGMPPGADFCLRAKGDSMTGAKINDGDIVFVKAQPAVENGEIAVVAIGEEATLKRVYYYPKEQKLFLQAENPAYPPQVYVGAALDEIHILGKAVALQTYVM